MYGWSMDVATLSEFVRKVYRASDTAGITASEYLDSLADHAMQAQLQGKAIIGSSGQGTTLSYAIFQNWNPAGVLKIIYFARHACAAEDLDDALATVESMATGPATRPDFRTGGFD